VVSENSQDDTVLKHLHAIGVELIVEWDALAFLYRHSASLGTAAQIAWFIGYDETKTVAALHRLEALGLIQRSRASQGIRMYQFSAPVEPGRYSCLLELMSLVQNRTGRLLLRRHLRHPSQEPRRRRDGGLRLA
jgi:hypothetical protein